MKKKNKRKSPRGIVINYESMVKMGEKFFSKILKIQIILTVLITFISIFFGFLAFSVYSKGLRWFIAVMIVIWAVLPLMKAVFYNKTKAAVFQEEIEKADENERKIKKLPKNYFWVSITGGVLAIIFILISFISTPLFFADKYRAMIRVKEDGSVTQEIEDFSTMQIPVVDKTLAFKLGDKKLGEDNLGSQFDILNYTMSVYEGKLYWLGAIEYSGFFKWINRRSSGTPGYIMISTTDPSDVKIVKKELKYVPSAYWWDNLQRRVYFSNFGKLIDYSNIRFELDDEGNPKYILSVLKRKFLLTNGTDIQGVIVYDPISGDSDYYEAGSQPNWIENVYSADIVTNQMDYWGNYVHGFFNSVFAKRDVMHVTEGYNYIYTNDRFYYYSGMTSYGSDESVVGMVLIDLKTKESIFCQTGGVTEYAAQQSAEGLVQDLKYRASFPMLINFNNIPTYFMTLKDNEGLIKKYAFVSLTDYTKVAVGDTVSQAQTNYSKVMNLDKEQTNTLTVKDIVPVVNDGTTYYYMRFEEEGFEGVYQAHIMLSDYLPFIKSGDVVNVVISKSVILSIELVN